jgi:hypothetical protein
VGLGLFVALIRPRTKSNLAFVVFAVSFGGVFVWTNGSSLLFDQPNLDAHPLVEIPRIGLYLVAAASLVAVAALFPIPVRRSERRLLVLPSVLVVPILAIAPLAAASEQTVLAAATVFTVFGMIAALIGVHAFWALRCASVQEAPAARQIGFLASALVLYSGFSATAGTTDSTFNSVLSPHPGMAAFYGLYSVLLGVGAALWLRATTKGHAPRTARNVALLTMFVMLLGLLYVAADLQFGGVGIVRLAAVTVLAYAIARHQLLGIDVKMRWTFSKTTLAAVFVAVFFVVSEAAQEFFGERAGSQYLGIFAAGVLVFAIAPLSRLADRLAEKVVPRTAGDGALDPAAPEREEAYKKAVLLALRDRQLSRAEERDLFQLARALGLETGRAHQILVELEGRVAKAG